MIARPSVRAIPTSDPLHKPRPENPEGCDVSGIGNVRATEKLQQKKFTVEKTRSIRDDQHDQQQKGENCHRFSVHPLLDV